MALDHLGLLCDVGELSALLAGKADIGTFLDRTVRVVAGRLAADVCSVYLYEEEDDELALTATIGLNPEAVGRVRLKRGDGLVGACLKELRPICSECASRNPKYRRFPEADEDNYQAFLAVPILRGLERVGVLVCQRTADRPFVEDDVTALRAIASQLAGMIENARVIMSTHHPERRDREADAGGTRVVRGQPASSGVGMGKAIVFDRSEDPLSAIARHGGGHALSRQDLEAALDATRRQIEGIQSAMDERLPEVASMIFTAHLMMLADDMFANRMLERCEQGADPADAVLGVTREYADMFQRSAHAYMREKVHDVEDLGRRILENLLHHTDTTSVFGAGAVVVARGLYPADLVELHLQQCAGVALVGGGVTTHLSIIARSLELPLVIFGDTELLNVPEGTPLIVDGSAGVLHVSPTEEAEKQYAEAGAARAGLRARAAAVKPETRTRDGTRVRLLANVNLLHDLELCRDVKAEGVGLYRTEFPFLVRSTFPTEDEQYMVYRRVVDAMRDREVTFRTLDIGGEKALAYFEHGEEANPQLGLRSIRFALRHPDIFQAQLRAILRAGTDAARLRIMFPMISSVEDFEEGCAAVRQAADALAADGVAHHASPELGMMVELPSVVELLPELAQRAAFFSIGTNDLVQYLLAVDRGNTLVASQYCSHHPAVLRVLARIVELARDAGRTVAVCGEMAQEARYIPFLLGIGLRRLSLDPHRLPDVQAFVEGIDLAEAERTAADLLRLHRIEDVERRLGAARPE